jgi:hypothetical protein
MKKNVTGIIILLAITYIIVSIVFKPFLHNPNSYMVSKSADAIKSYYNFAAELKYGSGLKNELVNYPYGEHIQMDNTHPFHLFFFKVFNKFFPVLKYGVAFINLSMIFSLLLVLPFLFLILRRYKLPVWYSMVISLIILFLSPQLRMIKGNFEMSYLFFIPMWWYFLLKFRDGKIQWLWGSLLFIAAIIGGLTSPYYAAFYSIFLFGIIIADCWINRKNLNPFIKQEFLLFFLALIPLVVVGGMIGLTDWVNDRPANPYGFFENHANIFSVFLPFDRFAQSAMANMYYQLNIHSEGRSNVGFPATIVAIILICSIAYRFYTRKKISDIFPEKEFNPYLLSAFLILLFSMCIPFNWGLGFLANLIPSLKQFVAPGRFAWIFYYVFTIYAAIFIYRYFEKYRNEGKQSKSVWLMVLVLMFWSADAISNAQLSFQKIVNKNRQLTPSDEKYLKPFYKIEKTPESFQAIFFIPFANSSGDKLYFEDGMNAFSEAMKYSFQIRLPLIECLSPRISISQALSSIQILADSSIRKTRFDDMNEKPIILLTMNDTLSEIEYKIKYPNEHWLKKQSDSLWGNKLFTVSYISPEVFERSYNNWVKWADNAKFNMKASPNPSKGGELKADVDLNKIYYLNFEDKRSSNVFSGKGALYKKGNVSEVFCEDFISKGLTGKYDLSFWLYIDDRTYSMPEAVINEIDRYNTAINTIPLFTKTEHNVYKNWVRVDQKITFKPGMKYQLLIKGEFITVDDLLLKPDVSNVYIKTADGKEMMNNFVIERK